MQHTPSKRPFSRASPAPSSGLRTGMRAPTATSLPGKSSKGYPPLAHAIDTRYDQQVPSLRSPARLGARAPKTGPSTVIDLSFLLPRRLPTPLTSAWIGGLSPVSSWSMKTSGQREPIAGFPIRTATSRLSHASFAVNVHAPRGRTQSRLHRGYACRWRAHGSPNPRSTDRPTATPQTQLDDPQKMPIRQCTPLDDNAGG